MIFIYLKDRVTEKQRYEELFHCSGQVLNQAQDSRQVSKMGVKGPIYLSHYHLACVSRKLDLKLDCGDLNQHSKMDVCLQ